MSVAFDAMGKGSAIIFLMLASALSGCTTSPRCAFTYDDHIKNDIVLPAVQAVEKQYTKNFDTDKPIITFEHGRTDIMFMFRETNALDPPSFIVELDPCTLKVLDAGETDGLTVTRD